MNLYLPGKGNSHFARLSAHAREYEDPYLTNNNMVQILTIILPQFRLDFD